MDLGVLSSWSEGSRPPGSIFVLSVERVWKIAWYICMLNQGTLDRDPAVLHIILG